MSFDSGVYHISNKSKLPALAAGDEDIDTQTQRAFGNLTGYEEAQEFESASDYRESREADQMAGLLKSYLDSGEDYYSEEDLMEMSEEERYKALTEERDFRKKEALIQDYLATDAPETQGQQVNIGRGRTTEIPSTNEKQSEAYLRSLDYQSLLDILYDDRRDLVKKYTEDSGKSNEYVMEAVPQAIAPHVRVVAKGNGFVVVKPLAEIDDDVRTNVKEELNRIQSEKTSDGSELKPYKPTMRDSTTATVAGVLKATGYSGGDDRAAYRYAEQLVGTRERIGLSDFLLAGAAFGAQEAAQDISRLNRSGDATKGDYIAPSLTLGLSAVEALPYAGLVAKGLKKTLRAGNASRAVNEVGAEIDEAVDSAVKVDEVRKKKAKAKLNIADAKSATAEVKQQQSIAAARTASENAEISDDLIRAYEDIHGVDISTTVKKTLDDGTEIDALAIDYNKVRNVSTTRLDDIDLPEDTLNDAAFGVDGYRNPVLNPDKYDAVVSVVAETKKMHPDAFDGAENTIEGLFNALVKNKLVLTDEFTEIMGKYGLNMDDVVRLSIGSVSRSAKVMRKHQQMKRLMDTDAVAQQKQMDDAVENFSSASKYVRRGENIIRGLMVSNFATAARNFQTTLIQFPIEGLTSTFDSILMSAGKGKSIGNTMTDMNKTFRDSFAMYGRTFSDPLEMRDYVKFMFEEGGKDGAKMMSRFYDQISEIQKFTGRGAAKEAQITRLMKEQKMSRKEATKVAEKITSGKHGEVAGKILDNTFSEVEDFVHFLNTPNRFQEHVSRHTFMLQRVEYLVKKHYDMDFFEMVNNGKMTDLWNNAVPGVPKDAPKFNELMADATDYAMRRTFAAPPETELFQTFLRTLNKIPGSTLVLPFPRFMFGSLEYMAAVTPYQALMFGGRAASRAVRGKKLVDLAADDTEKIARSMAGSLTMLSLYAGAEYITRDNQIRVGDKLVNPAPSFPVGQLAWIAKGSNILINEGRESFNDWFKGSDFISLFSGQNIKANTGLGEVMDDWVNFLAGEAKIGAGEQMAESVGKWFGNVATRALQPFQMYYDAQRVVGTKSRTLKNYSADPDMTMMGSFGQGFSEALKKRGFVSSEEEREAERQAYPLSRDGKTYNYPGFKLFMGLGVTDAYPAYKEFFHSYDITDRDLKSYTGVGTVDNTINDTMSGVMPSIAYTMAKLEMKMKSEGASTKDIRNEIRARTMQLVRNVKSKFKSVAGRSAGADDIPYVDALYALRTFNADAQQRMLSIFEETAGRPVNLSEAGDLKALLRIGKDKGYKQKLID